MSTYPVQYGYKVSIEISIEDGSKYVYVIAPFYMRKRWKLSFCFSLAFSDHEILKDNDVVTTLINAYGVN